MSTAARISLLGVMMSLLCGGLSSLPSAAQAVDSDVLLGLAKRARGIAQTPIVDGFRLSAFDAFVERDRLKVHLPVGVAKTGGVACDVQTVLLFNAAGEPYELEKTASYGERSNGADICIEIWSTDLIADAKGCSVYVHWSCGGSNGVARVPLQSQDIICTGEMVGAVKERAATENGQQPLSMVRNSGNLRVCVRSHDIAKSLVDSTTSTSREACIVALAKLGLSDAEYQRLLEVSGAQNPEVVALQVGKLREAFRRDATPEALAAVRDVQNTEARRWAILRLAYLGRKDLIREIPVEMPWGQLMKFRAAAFALADARAKELSQRE